MRVRIRGYTHAGEGVARVDGKPVFIPGAIDGELVECEITEKKKRFARGKLVKIIEFSKERTVPRCVSFGACGGCQIQHMSYGEQLAFKNRRVEETLRRLGGLKGVKVRPILGMDHPWQYRHTARFHVQKKGEEIGCGFFQPKTHRLLGLEMCPVLVPEFLHCLEELTRLWSEQRHGSGCQLYEIEMRKGYGTGEMMLILKFIADFPPQCRLPVELAEKLRVVFPAMVSVMGFVAPSPDGLGRWYLLSGQDYYFEQLNDLEFKVSAPAFFQNNPRQAEVLCRVVEEYVKPDGGETVLDVYCGVGLFSLFIAPRVGKVFGNEEAGAAVKNARQNARRSGISNTTFWAGKAEEVLPGLVEENFHPEVVILNPPRCGCHPDVLRAVADFSPEKVIYVSCDPATLARDLNIFSAYGFSPKEIQPVDMFPHTRHIECVTLIEKV